MISGERVVDGVGYTVLLYGGWALFCVWLERFARLWFFMRAHPPLPVHPASSGPAGDSRVCVIVAARDEAEKIEECLGSVLAQDYPNLNVVAVDDRSSDETGTIMDRLARADARLTVLHVAELPDNWLGKNHANLRASETPAARAAEYLVFTDGDVIFDPVSIRRAVSVADSLQLDHLCLTPQVITHSAFERALCYFFGFCYMLKCRPWRIPDSGAPRAFGGVGAFNLVRRTLYEEAGGHTALRMEVLDDYKLGKLIKRAGGRCLLLEGGDMVRVRWQVGWFGVVRGLEKNAFAGCDYSGAKLLLNVSTLAVVFVLPIAFALAWTGPARWGWLATVVLQWIVLTWVGRTVWCGLLSPICALVMIWTLVRSAVLAYARGGIRWRATFYPLAALRRGMV